MRPPEKDSRIANRIRGGVIGLGAMSGLVLGVWHGYTDAKVVEKQRNDQSAAQARKLERCQRYLLSLDGDQKQSRIVLARDMPRASQQDCGVDAAISDQDLTHITQQITSNTLPAGVSFDASSAELSLRMYSPNVLAEQIKRAKHDASTISDAYIVAHTGLDAMLGIGSGALAGAVLVVGISPWPTDDSRPDH